MPNFRYVSEIIIILLPFLAFGFKMVHVNCRLKGIGNVSRLIFADNLVPWAVKWENYNPPDITAGSVKHKPWADPDIGTPGFDPKWNKLDGNVNRQSHTGTYSIQDGRPLNVEGRTGLRGRGVLGRWGPNHAADPIVTRWKESKGSKIAHDLSQKNILQFCAIQRHDNGLWAIPGGMVDPGEYVSATLKREFLEEALNMLKSDKDSATNNKKMISDFFEQGIEIYRGYVDDPRNTDNAWIETVAVNFHDESGDAVGKLNLEAGDDAKHVQWVDINSSLKLHANHIDFIYGVVKRLNAHW